MEASIDLAGTAGSPPLASLPDLTFRRILEAPIALVFKAWTDPLQVAAWWGPHGYANPFSAVEPYPGGRFHVHMRAPDGSIQAMGGHFIDIEEPNRIVFATTLSDADGAITFEHVHTVTLTERSAGTAMILNSQLVQAATSMLPHLDGMEEGWKQSLERLASILKAI